MKRIADRALATILIITTLPLMAAVALGIKACGAGPAVVRERRVGPGNRVIGVLRFRTTVNGAVPCLADPPRMTAIGRFLLYTCIAEMPQLFNVLRGEMTLVGSGIPRPGFVDG